MKNETICSTRDSKTRHKQKETEHAAHAPTARHVTRRRKQNMQHKHRQEDATRRRKQHAAHATARYAI
jgi:hypothetical protein